VEERRTTTPSLTSFRLSRLFLRLFRLSFRLFAILLSLFDSSPTDTAAFTGPFFRGVIKGAPVILS
jgi:hypothetical protein